MENGKLTQLFKDIVSNSMQEMFQKFETSLESGKDKIIVSIADKSLPFRELLVNFGVKIGRLGNLEDGFIQKYINSDKSLEDEKQFITNFETLFWDGLSNNIRISFEPYFWDELLDRDDSNNIVEFSFEHNSYQDEVDFLSKKLSTAFKDLVDKYPQSFHKNKSSWIPLLIATTPQDTIVTDCRFYDELQFFNSVNKDIFPMMIRKIDPITEDGFVYDANSKLIDFKILKSIYLSEIQKPKYQECQTFNELKEFKENFQLLVKENTQQVIGPAEIDSAILSIALHTNEHTNIDNNIQNIIINSHKKLGLIDYKNYLGVDKELFSNNESIIQVVDTLINNNSDNKILLFIGNSQNGKDTIFNLLDSYLKEFKKDIKVSFKVSNENETIYLNNIEATLSLKENPLNIQITTNGNVRGNARLPKEIEERLNKELSIAILSEVSFKDIATFDNILVELKNNIYFNDLYEELKHTQISVPSISK